jgi:hypothetical protein
MHIQRGVLQETAMSEIPPPPPPDLPSGSPLAGKPLPPPGPVSFRPSFPDPSGWRWLSFVIDHNPCFLLSALLMFLGCYLLNSAMDVRAADIGKALLLLATINVYEAALIALGLALIPKPAGRGRDGVLLLFVQLLFLADGPFLVAQLVQATHAWGWLIALGLGGLAIVKAAIVQNALRIPVRGRTLGFLALQLLLIYGLPVILSNTQVAGELSAKAMYACWWAVGLLPVIYDVLARHEGLPHLTERKQFVRRSAIIVPWLLLVAHVAFFHYVYRAEFVPADLSPILLGLAVATRRIVPSKLLPANQLRAVRWALPAIAIAFAMVGPEMTLGVPLTSLTINPAVLTAGVAMVIYCYLHSLLTAACAIAAAFLMLLGRLLLTDILGVLRAIGEVISAVISKLSGLVPTTPTGWGIVAIVGAFALLGVGALVSLRPGRYGESPGR